ncbi:MAG: 7-carboxy-7-deazaguanine synthase QueE [Bacteroidia bacterium]|nr:7-carboxy-7-deazaguanine synthase QueE [Bacteroidia bacterium]
MIINLSREGIFPLVDDNGISSTGWTFPGTIQGEGKLCGIPSIFIRTQGCNLHCKWESVDENGNRIVVPCDTSHAISTTHGSAADVDAVAKSVIEQCHSSNVRHVVLTGGEPLLQAEASTELLRLLYQEGLHTTVETNGSYCIPEALKYISLLSISPKFIYSWDNMPNNYIGSVADSINVLRSYPNRDFQLKFVVSKYDDEQPILDKLSLLKQNTSYIQNSDILLMPMGGSKTQIEKTSLIAAEIAVKNGWRYTPRLHVDLWNNKERT